MGFGVMVGSGIGGLETIQNQVIRMHDKGPERVAPLFIPMAIGNMVAGPDSYGRQRSAVESSLEHQRLIESDNESVKAEFVLMLLAV